MTRLLFVVAAALLAASWAGTSQATTVREQLQWLSIGVAGLVVELAAAVLLVGLSRARLRRRARML